MELVVEHGDILDVKADVLVCSANPFLTLSGGVGGAFLLRYGREMQERLQRHLSNLGVRHVPPGTLVEMPPCGSPYLAVLHAVAVDGAYHASAVIVCQLLAASVRAAARISARSIAIPALATGYGHMTIEAFADAASSLAGVHAPPVERAILCLRDARAAAVVVDRLRPAGPGEPSHI